MSNTNVFRCSLGLIFNAVFFRLSNDDAAGVKLSAPYKVHCSSWGIAQMIWKESTADATDQTVKCNSTTLARLVSDGTRQFCTYLGGKHAQSMSICSLRHFFSKGKLSTWVKGAYSSISMSIALTYPASSGLAENVSRILALLPSCKYNSWQRLYRLRGSHLEHVNAQALRVLRRSQSFQE